MPTRNRNVLYFQAVMPARPKRRKAWRDAGRSGQGLGKAEAGRCGRAVANPSAGRWAAGAERPRDDPRAFMMPNCTPGGRERQEENDGQDGSWHRQRPDADPLGGACGPSRGAPGRNVEFVVICHAGRSRFSGRRRWPYVRQ